MARSIARAGDCLVPGLLLVMILGALVIGRSSIMKRLRSGAEILVVIAMLVSSMAIRLSMVRMASSEIV